VHAVSYTVAVAKSDTNPNAGSHWHTDADTDSGTINDAKSNAEPNVGHTYPHTRSRRKLQRTGTLRGTGADGGRLVLAVSRFPRRLRR
jgi:hypothetical protein